MVIDLVGRFYFTDFTDHEDSRKYMYSVICAKSLDDLIFKD